MHHFRTVLCWDGVLEELYICWDGVLEELYICGNGVFECTIIYEYSFLSVYCNMLHVPVLLWGEGALSDLVSSPVVLENVLPVDGYRLTSNTSLTLIKRLLVILSIPTSFFELIFSQRVDFTDRF